MRLFDEFSIFTIYLHTTMQHFSAHPIPTSNLNACTYNSTGGTHRTQYWKRCLDCSTQSNVGACLNCISVCHAGHRIDPTLRRGQFFCDCGASGCKLSNGVGVVAPVRHLDPPPIGWGGIMPSGSRGATPPSSLGDGPPTFQQYGGKFPPSCNAMMGFTNLPPTRESMKNTPTFLAVD
jgi:hypothetical protein